MKGTTLFLSLLNLSFAVLTLGACTQAAATPLAAAVTSPPRVTDLPSAPTGRPTAVPPTDRPLSTDESTRTPTAPPPGAGGVNIDTTPTPQYTDIAYASLSTIQKLDLYLPEGNGPFPLVVNVHGGGFIMGDKSDPPSRAAIAQFVANGYAVASIGYRLSGEAKAPAQIHDVKAAVRFLRANAEKYDLNPDKFAGYGASAGGNLVALLGTSCGVPALEGSDLGNAAQSSCVQAVVDWFGPTDLALMDRQFAGTSCPADHTQAGSVESQYIGAPLLTRPDLVQAANPITYVTAKAPPFLIQHGTADCIVPPAQSQMLYDALKSAIGADKVTLTYLKGAGHSDLQFSSPANLRIVLGFLSKYLR